MFLYSPPFTVRDQDNLPVTLRSTGHFIHRDDEPTTIEGRFKIDRQLAKREVNSLPWRLAAVLHTIGDSTNATANRYGCSGGSTTPGSKPSCSTNHFHPRLPSLFRTDSMVSCPAPFLLSTSVCFLVFSFYWFLPRDAMLARYMPWSCVCVSVRLSVRVSVRHKSEFY